MGVCRKWVSPGLYKTVAFASSTMVPDEGKLVTIVDVIDQNRCVVYGPTSGVPRQVLGYKRLSLTDIKINIGRGAKAKTAETAWNSEDVEGQWAKTSWAKKLAARKAKASANDFDRFKGMVAHKNHMVRAAKPSSKRHNL